MNFQQFFGWFWDPVRDHYADFDGRVTRQAFWMYVLIYFIIQVLLTVIRLEMLAGLVTLALFVPSIAITTRRLHDTGLSGWWQLVGIIPIIGWIILIVLTVRGGEMGANKYGMNPAGTSSAATATPMGDMPSSAGGTDSGMPSDSTPETPKTEEGDNKM